MSERLPSQDRERSGNANENMKGREGAMCALSGMRVHLGRECAPVLGCQN